jgi:hypothetical protein
MFGPLCTDRYQHERSMLTPEGAGRAEPARA